MLGRAFLVVSVLFLALLAFAFYQDFSRPWVPIQQSYAQKYGQDFPLQVQQPFPKVKVNNQFVVEQLAAEGGVSPPSGRAAPFQSPTHRANPALPTRLRNAAEHSAYAAGRRSVKRAPANRVPSRS